MVEFFQRAAELGKNDATKGQNTPKPPQNTAKAGKIADAEKSSTPQRFDLKSLMVTSPGEVATSKIWNQVEWLDG